jgi:hypothetical protein
VIGKGPADPDKRGVHVEPLIRYLYGPGRHEEHTDPHIVAGWRDPAGLEPPLLPDGRRDFRRLCGLLNQPHAALGKWGTRKPVWHCVMRAAPADKMLSDAEWAQIARDVMHRTGLSPDGEEDEAVRWIAVRHGPEHIHIVAMLARQDGRRWRLPYEKRNIRQACLAAEKRYGLQSTAPGDGTAPRCPSRAENEKAARRGLGEPARVTLRRAVITTAAGAAGAEEFFARLDQAGILVRRRYSVARPGEVTGYSVALPGDTGRDGKPVWFGGGKLAADLTWPRLSQRWAPGTRPGDPFTAEERAAMWEHASRAADAATARIRHLAGTDPAAAADAAWAAAGTLHVAAAALGSRTLRKAADSYERAARVPYGRIPRPTPAGNNLRRAARLIAAYAFISGDRTLEPLLLIIRLAALAETVAMLRETQQHNAQAASAHAAARTLRAAAGRQPDAGAAQRPAAAVATASFPQPPRPRRPDPAAARTRRPAARGPRPPRRRRP